MSDRDNNLNREQGASAILAASANEAFDSRAWQELFDFLDADRFLEAPLLSGPFEFSPYHSARLAVLLQEMLAEARAVSLNARFQSAFQPPRREDAAFVRLGPTVLRLMWTHFVRQLLRWRPPTTMAPRRFPCDWCERVCDPPGATCRWCERGGLCDECAPPARHRCVVYRQLPPQVGPDQRGSR